MTGFQKGPKIATLKERRRRKETRIRKSVRTQCADRDGFCRLQAVHMRDVCPVVEGCGGFSEWAHFGDFKRAHTRGMDPEVRHTTAGSLMLCGVHHRAYDAKQLTITALTEAGCDGPLEFA